MPKGDAKEGYLNTNAHLEAKVAMLMAQLAESQARELRLREALDNVAWRRHPSERPNQLVEKLERFALDGLATPQDDSALRAMVAAEREACAKACDSLDPRSDEFSDEIERAESRAARDCAAAIRARGDK